MNLNEAVLSYNKKIRYANICRIKTIVNRQLIAGCLNQSHAFPKWHYFLPVS